MAARLVYPDSKVEASRLAPLDAGFLWANNDVYDRLVKRVQAIDPRTQQEAALAGVACAARIAATFHAGRFADGAIENLAYKIGAELGEFSDEGGRLALSVAAPPSRRRILHVATDVLGVGGHTRMLYHWAQNDQTTCHSLALVDQKDVPIPQWLSGAIEKSGGRLAVAPQGSSIREKAKWLRAVAANVADLVVLHHAAFDVVPTVAFADPNSPPVVVLNHADHAFWLGSSVADMVINLRTAGAEHTARRRFVENNTVIPIPLADPAVAAMSRGDARRVLGIPEDQVMLLSIGRPEKFRPCGPYDFVATACKILERSPRAHLYLVGESLAGITPYLRCVPNERLHFVGSTADGSVYRTAADVYLETFPFGGQTALLEAALCEIPVAPAYAPLFPLLVANDDAVLEWTPNPLNEEEHLECVDRLIRHPERRTELGRQLRKCLLVDHVGPGWLDRLAALYRQTDALTHNPGPIPMAACAATDEDISLSLWHAVADGKTYTTGAAEDGVVSVLRHTAYVEKFAGDYTRARQFAWSALRHNSSRRASWRLLAVTILGKAGGLLRRALDQLRQRA